ncbi:MAG: hypothetical protein GKR95_09465 [Gammaproteobacteria bacterium]|nr:hypothetical protein [Gammaproteobacteria bacterium]
MSTEDTCCSIAPYFKVEEGRMDEFKALTARFVEATGTEEGALYYGFSYNGDVAYCREGYINGESLLAHLDNVGALVQEALTMSSLDRIEIHGPESEVAKLREPLAGLNPAFSYLSLGSADRISVSDWS